MMELTKTKPRAAVTIIFRHAPQGPELAIGVRRGEPEKGQWGYPGGGVNDGESPRDGAARELMEEAGVHVEPSSLQYVITQTNTHTVYVFTAIVDEHTELKSGSDMADMRWMPLAKLPKLAFNGNHYVQKAAKKLKLDPGVMRPVNTDPIVNESISPETIADLITEDPDIAP
jgi:ADP-ribose pyrophosphatase YjhB (NUDIX family)